MHKTFEDAKAIYNSDITLQALVVENENLRKQIAENIRQIEICEKAMSMLIEITKSKEMRQKEFDNICKLKKQITLSIVQIDENSKLYNSSIEKLGVSDFIPSLPDGLQTLHSIIACK